MALGVGFGVKVRGRGWGQCPKTCLQAAAAAATVAARLALGPVLLGEPRLHREADAARVGVHLDHAHLQEEEEGEGG